MVTTGESDTVVIVLAVLGFLTTTITAILAAFVALKTGQVRKDVKSTHDLVNGLTGELRAAQSREAGAIGFTAGEAAERDRSPHVSVSSEPQEVTIVNPEPVPVIVDNVTAQPVPVVDETPRP